MTVRLFVGVELAERLCGDRELEVVDDLVRALSTRSLVVLLLSVLLLSVVLLILGLFVLRRLDLELEDIVAYETNRSDGEVLTVPRV